MGLADAFFNMKSAMAGTFYRLTDFRCVARPGAAHGLARPHPRVHATSRRRARMRRVARASHILLKGYDEATVRQLEAWKAEIADDVKKFAEIATQHSLCPSRRKGGGSRAII